MKREKTILLVEDNVNDQALILRALKHHSESNEVVVVRHGAEAIDYISGTGKFEGRDLASPPALVLLDLNMPKVGGLEVIERIRANEYTTLVPIVVFSSSAQGKDMARGYRLGANSYVRKPVVFEEFSAAVHQMILYWLTLNEAPPAGLDAETREVLSVNQPVEAPKRGR